MADVGPTQVEWQRLQRLTGSLSVLAHVKVCRFGSQATADWISIFILVGGRLDGGKTGMCGLVVLMKRQEEVEELRSGGSLWE